MKIQLTELDGGRGWYVHIGGRAVKEIHAHCGTWDRARAVLEGALDLQEETMLQEGAAKKQAVEYMAFHLGGPFDRSAGPMGHID